MGTDEDIPMELIRGSHNLAARHYGCVATIGNFDGVHLGHQAVIRRLREAAAEAGLPATLVTFEPHPREHFQPAAAPARITGLRDKLRALSEAGVDRVLCLEFGARLASQSAESFVEDVLLERLGVHYLMVGDDFRFGHRRRGDYSLLERYAASRGFRLTRMPTVRRDGIRVSSTAVREALTQGDLDAAARLLGRRYRISGRVARGRALGRQLGWPTINLVLHHGRPAVSGIFAVAVHGVGSEPHPGVANVGNRPTVAGRRTLLEVHLLDFEGDLYGRHVSVEFQARRRDELHFDSLEALSREIDRDAAWARAYFAAGAGT